MRSRAESNRVRLIHHHLTIWNIVIVVRGNRQQRRPWLKFLPFNLWFVSTLVRIFSQAKWTQRACASDDHRCSYTFYILHALVQRRMARRHKHEWIENYSFYTDDFKANENVTWQRPTCENIFGILCVVANDERIWTRAPAIAKRYLLPWTKREIYVLR